MPFDSDQAAAFLSRMFPDGCGRISLSRTIAGGVDSKHFDMVTKAVEWAAAEHETGCEGIYFRTTPLVPGDQMIGKRGRAGDSSAVTMLVADLDYGTIGHEPSPNGLPLPATAEEARKMIGDLPAPTLIANSGGGEYPIWKLAEPLLITDENRAAVKAVLDQWQKIIVAAGVRLGWHYGSVGDLARLLRLPGSVNRKVGLERPCKVVQDDRVDYRWDELAGVVKGLSESPVGAVTRTIGGTASGWEPIHERGPFNVLAELAEWSDILPDWERVACPDSATLEAWKRPGGTHGVSAKVLRAQPEILVVHSTDAGLPSGAGQKLTKGRVYAHLNYGGDVSAAASALRNGTAVNLPAVVAGAIAVTATAIGTTATNTTAIVTTSAIPAEAGDQPPDAAAELLDLAVAHELRILRARAAARAIFDAETRPGESNDPATLAAEYLTVDQLADLPKLAPLVGGVLSRGTYAVLSGRDSTFKSFVALDWALCLATGKNWQARQVERVKVLYIAGEGVYGLADRVRAWESGWKTKVDPEWFTVRKSAVNLFRPGPAFHDLLARVPGCGFVVLDTMRRHSGGADGNTTDMGVVVDNVDRIKRATDDGTVLVLAHTDKGDNDSRGFSGIEDDADTVWHARRQGLRVDLECTKQKDGPDQFQVQLEMHTVGDSLIVSAGAGVRADEEGSADQIVMQAMSGMFASTGATATEVIEATGLSKPTFYRARGRLLDSGRLLSVGSINRRRLEMP